MVTFELTSGCEDRLRVNGVPVQQSRKVEAERAHRKAESTISPAVIIFKCTKGQGGREITQAGGASSTVQTCHVQQLSRYGLDRDYVASPSAFTSTFRSHRIHYKTRSSIPSPVSFSQATPTTAWTRRSGESVTPNHPHPLTPNSSESGPPTHQSLRENGLERAILATEPRHLLFQRLRWEIFVTTTPSHHRKMAHEHLARVAW